MKSSEQIFKKGSTTFYTSSLFFPKNARNEVIDLYAFVRVADDFVDCNPQDKKGFITFRKEFEQSYLGKASGKNVIDNFVRLSHKRKFEKKWIDAFLDAMYLDLTKKKYDNLSQTKKYMYGSAEVIGLFMSRIMGLEKKAEKYAVLLGRAFQYINFIRDVHEDYQDLGRQYLPVDEMKAYGLKSLKKENVIIQQDFFETYIRDQIKAYQVWQQKAEQGFKYIPRRYRIPIKTAADMYMWTSREIFKNPQVIYEKKVKPPKTFIIWKGFYHFIFG